MIQPTTAVVQPQTRFSTCPPEQNSQLLGGPTGWLEPYKVTRSGKDYWYHRYCWQAGRSKTHHRHIKQGKLSLIQAAIAEELAPQVIQILLK